MKKILIINEEIPALKENNSRVIIKKNKTIIKDRNLYESQEFLNQYVGKYNFLLEEWEIANKEKIQIIVSNNGKKLRPVHIKSDLYPEKGDKCLMQSEKMVIIKVSIPNKLFEISKCSIDDKGEISQNVIKIATYNEDMKEIVDMVPENFKDAVMAIIKNYNFYCQNGYLAPIFADALQ